MYILRILIYSILDFYKWTANGWQSEEFCINLVELDKRKNTQKPHT